MRYKKNILGLIVMILCAVFAVTFCFFPGKVKVTFYPLIKAVGGAMVYDENEGYSSIGWNDFIIEYPKDKRDVAYMVLDSLKSDSRRVYDFFSYRPSKPVEIVIYDNADDMRDALHISRNRTVEGAYYMGKITILSPYEWPDAPKMDIEGYFRASSPLVHEITHMVVDEMTRGNVPVWLTEGIATYMEYRIMGYDWTAGIDVKEPYSIEQLTKNFDKLDEYQAYRQSFLIVKDMVDRYGDKYIVSILDSMGHGEEIGAKLLYK